MKTFLIAVGVLILTLIVALLCLRRDWIEPLPGVVLTPSRPPLELQYVPEDGAFDLLCRAGDALGGKKLRVEWDRALLAFAEDPQGNVAVEATKDLEDAAEALRLARLASTKGDAQVPTPHFDGNLSYLSKTKALVKLLSVSAARKAAQGDAAGALDDLEAGIRLGQILSRGGTTIHHLVDIACTGICCQTLGLLSLNRALPPATLRDARTRLERLEAALEPLPEILRQEHLFNLEAVDAYDKAGGKGIAYVGVPTLVHALLWSRTETRRNFAALNAHVIALAEKPYDPRGYDALNAAVMPHGFWDVLFRKDPEGLILASGLLTSLKQQRSTHERCLANFRATRAFLAIREFQAAQGRAPKDPAELVPGFLASWPLDPFDGKPLRYRLNPDGSWVVYSTGADLSENGKDPGWGGLKGVSFPSTAWEEFSKQTHAKKP